MILLFICYHTNFIQPPLPTFLSLLLHLLICLILSIPYNCSHSLSLRGNTTSKGWFLPMSTLSSPTRMCKSIFRPITQQNHLSTSWRQKSTSFTPCSSFRQISRLPFRTWKCSNNEKNYFRQKFKTKHQLPSKLSQNHGDLLYYNLEETNQAWGKKQTMENCSNKGKLQPKWEFWRSQKGKKGALTGRIRKP